MASNPNPDRITDAFWEVLWEQVRAALGSDLALGGIYAAKCRYHDTRQRNRRVCPGNYSIRLADDLAGPDDVAAAIDWTFRSAQRGDYSHIIRITKRLLAAYDDPDDPRIGPHVTAEFYGTTNGRTVVGRLHGRSATSDDSHLWHIHFASHRRYVGNKAVARAVLSVVTGESLAAWKAREYAGTVVPVPAGRPLLRREPMSTGSRVRQLQRALNEVIDAGLKVDGAYGRRTEAAVEEFQRQAGLAVDGIYGPNTAAALRGALQEDEDMPISDEDVVKIRREVLGALRHLSIPIFHEGRRDDGSWPTERLDTLLGRLRARTQSALDVVRAQQPLLEAAAQDRGMSAEEVAQVAAAVAAAVPGDLADEVADELGERIHEGGE